MAYGKKKPAKGMVNRNPWTRDSQDNPTTIKRPSVKRSQTFPSRILTSKSFSDKMTTGVSMPNKPNNKGMEKRGGARRAPFLSNTGPEKKY
tara:strand:+ start:2956 stop:3228 length:273 start_codon:yes stop_codon:yes gene_type:complete